MVMTLSQPENEDDTDEPMKFRLTVNPAVIKGGTIAAVSLFILLAPDISVHLIKPALALGLIGIGGSELWAGFRKSAERSWSARLLAGLSVVVGIGMLIYPAETLELVVFIIAIYLLVRGVAAALRLIFHRSKSIVMDVIAAGAFLSLGVLLTIVPEQIIQSLVGGVAVAGAVIGGVVIAYGMRAGQATSNMDVHTFQTIARSWIETRDIGTERRQSLSEDLYFEAPAKASKLAAWWVMLILSVTIATYAILQDSTAVVIGAMLIAPLMTPIVGAAAAIVNGRPVRLARSLALVGGGVFAAITLAYVIGKWSPDLIPYESNSQITSRTSPNVLDMAIALAAGAAGAFAMINRRVASGLAGVAIAVALVPPLGVVGLMIGAVDFESAWGAFLLFLTNLVAILLSATLVFGVSGWTSVARLRSKASSIALTVGVILAAAMVILLPLMFTAQGILIASSQQATANKEVKAWIAQTSPKLTVDLVTVEGNIVEAEVSGAESVSDPADLAQTLTDDFGEETTVQITLTPTTVVTSTVEGGSTQENPDSTSSPVPAPTQSASDGPSPAASAAPAPATPVPSPVG
jgi:uncharacterized hydrophobic protein (TIGR00271 family)